MNARSAAAKAAFAAQLALCGEDGMYEGSQAFRIRAVRGQTPFREVGDDGRARIVRSVDWLFDIAAFRQGTAGPEEPEDGDTFVVQAGPRVTEYRVTPFNGEPCYRPDPTGTFFRVHTVEAGKGFN